MMNRRLDRRGLLACLAASVMLVGCEAEQGAPPPKPGPPPEPPADAKKLFERPQKIPSTKPGGMGRATPPGRMASGPELA